jgi:hypothetical protein
MNSRRDPKRKSTHPGEVLRENPLLALKISQGNRRINPAAKCEGLAGAPQLRA